MVNDLTGLNKLKTKVDDLDIDKMQTVLVDLKKLSDVVSKKVRKKTVYNKLNTKINNLEIRIPDASNLIQTNQYNADKQKLDIGENIGDFDKKNA